MLPTLVHLVQVMQGKYLAPWYYLEDGSDAGVAFSKLVSALSFGHRI